MNEDVAATDFAKEDKVSGVVKESSVTPGYMVIEVENGAPGEVLDKSAPTN